jgi:sulfatase maturation enzyme AslB (radical SAM superfamily)
VNLIYGRGITDLLREMPLYVTLLSKYARIKLFHAKIPLYGSVDVNNICNLRCTHCYWWLNQKEEERDLSAEQWRQIIMVATLYLLLMGLKERKNVHVCTCGSCCYMQCSI